jgi:hypothetical protein
VCCLWEDYLDLVSLVEGPPGFAAKTQSTPALAG